MYFSILPQRIKTENILFLEGQEGMFLNLFQAISVGFELLLEFDCAFPELLLVYQVGLEISLLRLVSILLGLLLLKVLQPIL